MFWYIVVILVLLIPLTALFLDSQLGRALAARLERGSLRGEEGLGTRVAALEADMDRLSKDLLRLQEESEFLRRLLEGKTSASALPPGDTRD